MRIERTDKRIELFADSGKAIRKKGTTKVHNRVIMSVTKDVNDYEEIKKGEQV